MGKSKSYNFNRIIKEIIEKSLFTERQIEIILKKKKLMESDFHITKGAYFRQVQQSRSKIMGFFYSLILLRGLGIISQEDVDVITKLSEQISVIQNSDVFPEKEDEIINVINTLVSRSTKL